MDKQTKIKIWLSVICLGVILFCVGVATLIMDTTKGTANINGWIIAAGIVSVIVGVSLMSVGFVFYNRSKNM